MQDSVADLTRPVRKLLLKKALARRALESGETRREACITAQMPIQVPEQDGT